MDLKNWGWAITAMVFCLPLTFAEAVSLQLQSGRVMEGEVIEETKEYIKLKNDKGEYKIPLKLIDEEATQDLNPAQKKEITTDKSMADWEKWMEANKAYAGKTDMLQKQMFKATSKSTQAINQALRSNNVPAAGRAAEEMQSQIGTLIRQLDALTPPDELKTYQEKIKSCFKFSKKSMDLWKLGDQQGYHQYRKKSFRSLMSSMEELRDAHQLMGAPPGYIDVLNRSMEEYKADMGKLYH